MEILKVLIPAMLTLSLALLVLGAAMASARGEFLFVLRRPLLLARAVIAVDVVPVLGAVTVVALLSGIPATAKAAIILMAISPVPPLVPGKSLKFGGRREYIYGLQIAMALLSIVSVPLLGSLTADHYHSAAQFPMSVVASNVAIGLIAPLAGGIVVRSLWPAFAPRAAGWVLIAANILLVIAFVPVFAGSWHAMIALIGDGTVVAMAAVVGITILGGHVLGGGKGSDRSSLVFASAMRHPGIALALAGANHGDAGISAGVLLFLLVGIIVLVPYQFFLRPRQPRSGPDDAAKADV